MWRCVCKKKRLNNSKDKSNKSDKNNITKKLETDKTNSTSFEWKNIRQKESIPEWKKQAFLHLQPLETENQYKNYNNQSRFFEEESVKSKNTQKNKFGIVRNLFFSISILLLVTLLIYYK